jgi:thioredoxin reductase (NADPH)
MHRPATRPLVLAVDGDADALGRLGRDLASRYGVDYAVRTERSAAGALECLRGCRERGEEVAVVVAAQSLSDGTGLDLLLQVHALQPAVKRVLLRGWYGPEHISAAELEAVSLGRIDSCVPKPWDPPDVNLHPAIVELLAEWTEANRPRLDVVRIVGHERERRAYELRDLLERSGIPYSFCSPASPAAAEVVDRAAASTDDGGSPLPAVALLDGRVLVRPSNGELARALGGKTHARQERYGVAIVGGGPAGLAAAVAASSEGLETVVVEREAVGGQAGSTSLIRNYLGFPRGISGAHLATRACRQASVFGAEFILMRGVTALDVEGDDRVLTLSDGTCVRSSAVVVATGVTYRRLRTPTLDRLVGAGVYYGTSRSEAPAMRGRRVVVVGGGNSAGQAALHVSRHADHVTLVTRRATLGETMSAYLIRELRMRPNVDVRSRTTVVDGHGVQQLAGVTLRDERTLRTEDVAAHALFVLIGAEPHSRWLPSTTARDDRGFLVTGADLLAGSRRRAWGLNRAPLPFETSVPGVFAAGDVRCGAVQRVASAAGAGAIAVHSVHTYLELLRRARLGLEEIA